MTETSARMRGKGEGLRMMRMTGRRGQKGRGWSAERSRIIEGTRISGRGVKKYGG